MRLNFFEAYQFFAYYAKTPQPFKKWLANHKQGKMAIGGEKMDGGIYEVCEAEGNAEFKAWLLDKRRKDKQR